MGIPIPERQYIDIESSPVIQIHQKLIYPWGIYAYIETDVVILTTFWSLNCDKKKCYFDNFQYDKWRKFRTHVDISVPM